MGVSLFVIVNIVAMVLSTFLVLGDEFVVLKTPSFAESISEGDVRWDKGNYHLV